MHNPLPPDDDAAAKRRCRAAAFEARAQAHAQAGAAAGRELAAIGLEFLGLEPAIVSGFTPFGAEIDALPLMARLAGEGWRTALPVVAGRNLPLVFRAWVPGEPTVAGAWSIPVPPETAPEVAPDVLLVPMLAFDGEGYRLGYGGGFYDRTLAALRSVKPVVAVGVAFAGQEVGRVPREAHDEPLDWILTEAGPNFRAAMRLIFLGDVVGRAGRAVVGRELPELRRRLKPDLVVLNGENAAGGFGITEAIYNDFRAAGADVVTLGNHSWDQREALVFIERAPELLRPVNYPHGTPGRGVSLYATPSGAQVLVLCVMGTLMIDSLDNPFAAAERELGLAPLGERADAVIVEMHAEATSEKMAMGHFCDGRASMVVGTHTHVPTGDHQILPGGTAYLTDAGMCGDYDSVIGMDKNEPMNRFLTKLQGGRFEPAMGDATLCGLAVETDDRSGLAVNVAPIRVGGRLEPAWPAFW